MLKKGTCGFAHSLAEVLPPNEKTTTYCGVWRDGVDRFYAQQMSERQIARVDRYWRKFSATFERPVWCYGMLWWFQERPLREHPELGWDFGIWQDVDTMKRARKLEVVPFEWARNRNGLCIWDRLEARRDALRRAAARLPRSIDYTLTVATADLNGPSDNSGAALTSAQIGEWLYESGLSGSYLACQRTLSAVQGLEDIQTARAVSTGREAAMSDLELVQRRIPMTDSTDDSDGSDSMRTDTVGDSVAALGSCGIDNGDVRISLCISDTSAAGMLNRVGMQTEAAGNSVPAVGAACVDPLAGMVVEDVSGLGSPCAETDCIPGFGGSSTAVVATGRPCGSGGVSQGAPTIAQSSAESWVGAGFL